MLEYYNGVLFLTTNRVGVLDEAVKSRVHLHLKYYPLNRDQTVQIFKHNIQRLRVIEQQRVDETTRLSIAENDVLAFALEHYNKHARGTGMGLWNGRQIRNAFLIAAALAHHDGDLKRKSNPEIQKQLRASHFELVHQATMSYDEERAETLGYTDNELASGRLERVDGRVGMSNYDAMQAGSYSGRPPFGTPQYSQQMSLEMTLFTFKISSSTIIGVEYSDNNRALLSEIGDRFTNYDYTYSMGR